MQLQQVETSKGPRLYEVSWQNYFYHQRPLWPCNIWHITCDNSSIIQQDLRPPFLCVLRSISIPKIVFIFTLMKRGCWVEEGWKSLGQCCCGMMKVKLRHVYVTFISIWIKPVDIRVVLKYPLPFPCCCFNRTNLYKTQCRMSTLVWIRTKLIYKGKRKSSYGLCDKKDLQRPESRKHEPKPVKRTNLVHMHTINFHTARQQSTCCLCRP